MMQNRAFKNWSRDEINFLESNYLQMSLTNIAAALRRSYYGIKCQVRRLKLFEKFVENPVNPYEHLSIAERAYIAGFIDGEGCIGVNLTFQNGSPIRATPSFRISNSNREVIEWLIKKINFGRWSHSTVYTDSRIHNKQLRKTYEFKIENRFRIEPFLQMILPYLQVKKTITKEVLKFLRMKIQRGKYSLQDWKQILRIKSLIDSASPQHVRCLNSLAKFVKELEAEQTENLIKSN